MTSYSWNTDTSGDWNTGTLWTGGTVPNDLAADVTIDAASTLTAYTVTIASGESITVDSLSMNGSNELAGTNNPAGYYAADLELDGTLAFAAGSAGAWDGSLQTNVFTAAGDNAAIINGGTLNAFFAVEGTITLTGTNGVYITSEIEALSGTVTIDTPIAEMTGNTLFDGIFAAVGPGSVVDLGGAATAAGPGAIVNIATIEGPQGNPTGWTELTFADPTSIIDEWNGTGYVSVETSLTEISAGATIDLTFGRNYNTTNTLTIDNLGSSVAPGMLDIQGSTVTTGGIDLNRGIAEGYGTIASAVVNNGTLIALGGAVSGTLEVTGSLTGTGAVVFDLNDQNLDQTGKPTADPTKATLLLDSGVSAGQTITMNGGDTLVLGAASTFAGTIIASVGDQIVLRGQTVTSAVLNNGTLVVSDGAATVASLALGGSYAGDSFAASGSTVTIGSAGSAPTPTPTPAGSVTPPPAGLAIFDTTTGQPSSMTGQAYSGPVSGLTSEFITTTTDSLNVSVSTPGWFIHTGSGNDAVAVSSGTNVMDGSTGSNFLAGGSGNDTFFVDDRGPTSDIWSTCNNFHSGDGATVWGVTPSDFTLSWVNGQGANGYTGLTLHATAPGEPTASLTLVGYSSADLTNGKLTVSFGATATTGGAPGSTYMHIQAN
jgi:hypothetical protein